MTDHKPKYLIIPDWDDKYENHKTRILKKVSWVPLTNNNNSHGYISLISGDNGPEHFACWVAILQISSLCEKRGVLMYGKGLPHNAETFSTISRISLRYFQSAIPKLVDLGWLDEIDPSNPKKNDDPTEQGHTTAVKRRSNAGKRQPNAVKRAHERKKEREGKEERESNAGAGEEPEPQDSPPPLPEPPKPPEREARADDGVPPSELTEAARKMYDELKDIGSLSTIEYKHVYDACRSYPKVDLALATDTISIDADNMVNHINEPFAWLRRQLARIDQFNEKGDCRTPLKKEIGRIDGGGS